MTIAVLTTLAITRRVDLTIGALAFGGIVGSVVAQRVQMTQMPELVAAMHSLVGLAAVLIAIAVVNNPAAFGVADPDPGRQPRRAVHRHVRRRHHLLRLGDRLRQARRPGQDLRLFSSAPVVFKGQHLRQPGAGDRDDRLRRRVLPRRPRRQWPPFIVMTAIAFVLGVLIIIPIGGADMPVVISMLNSYSGWAASGIGFSLNNPLLIVAGSLVGSSGAILSYIMCKAMNRSFFSVILGGFGAAEARRGGEQRRRSSRARRRRRVPARQRRERHHRPGLRPGGGARPARGEGDGAQADGQGRQRALRDPPGRRPHARAT